LNLCPKKPLENAKKLREAIEKVAKCVNSVHKSPKMSEAVELAFGKSLKKRCATRWNTNFEMAQSALDFPWDTEGAVFKDNRLNRHEVKLIGEFVKVMGPFEHIFIQLQDVAYPTICLCIPALYYLRNEL